MDKTNQDITVKLRDRVTFDTDEGIQAGYVNDLRRDLGNGELHAWVEVDHQLPGCFRAVPVSDILTSDQIGPPSTCYIGFDWATHAACLNTPLVIDDTAGRLERAESTLRIHGFTESDGQLWIPPVAYRPIEIFDVEHFDMAHQAGLDDARRGEHELFPDENRPLEGIEGDKPFCRFRFYKDGGDASVGEPSRAYWALSADQSGTELAQILAVNAQAMTDRQRIVPLDPSDEMKAAGVESDAWSELIYRVVANKWWPYSCKESATCVSGIYRAMLAAA